ncbi:MAG: hypothetical protein IPO48_11020 [Saprospiraceae bacterium]|nr:hypothetical protein [Saprospiraceae bacterium]
MKQPSAPAFLIECGFMDHPIDYNNLWDEMYIDTLVDSLVMSIIQVYNT